MVLNVLTYTPGLSILHIPSVVGKTITQGSLSVALLLALTANRKITIRPGVFLCLMTLLALEAVLACMLNPIPKGTLYRAFRDDEFVAVMWLLSPHWGREDMLLIRCHLKTLVVVLCSVIVGFLIAPSRVLHNRFAGVLWPVPGTQVAHYAAIVLGLATILWLCRKLRGKHALILVAISGPILLLTHTRTALTGMAGGVLVAGISLILVTPRVRRFFGLLSIAAALAFVSAWAAISAWLARGQNTTELLSLSGRTKFWGPLLSFPRTRLEQIFGFGLSNGTFGGQPIDSNWLSSYQDQGLFGVIICSAILVFLYVAAGFQADRTKRALALFLITYCLLASITEDGFTSPTTYSLDLMLAASLLIPFSLTKSAVDD